MEKLFIFIWKESIILYIAILEELGGFNILLLFF